MEPQNGATTTEDFLDESSLHELIQMLSDDVILVPSNQQPYENHQIQYPYVQAPSDSSVLNQHGMYSSPRPMFNPVPELSFNIGQNLPPERHNVNSNRDIIPSTGNVRTRQRATYRRGRMPSLCQGSSSRSRREVIQTEHETIGHQNVPPNTYRARGHHPWNPRQTPIRNRLYEAENGLPVDPFLRAMQLNPNFNNSRGNN
ncbi:uncharacterized protein LOC132602479 isoform X2 [Lycium barbarum]|uniref:uncharacterized protein LOC132602479 isoform X2 n=1 Tax=Lycium barbarum TaxID=112863 RepID=UPI00293E53FB|nr:uncharacterized protein LOC132602479 isoform X2 [Lycium barbarum]